MSALSSTGTLQIWTGLRCVSCNDHVLVAPELFGRVTFSEASLNRVPVRSFLWAHWNYGGRTEIPRSPNGGEWCRVEWVRIQWEESRPQLLKPCGFALNHGRDVCVRPSVDGYCPLHALEGGG